MKAGDAPRQNGRRRLDGPICNRDPGDTTRDRQQQRLAQEQLDELRVARTERGPHGKLPRPRGDAAQNEVGNVGAGHQEDESHGGQEHQQRCLEPSGDLLAERLREESQCEAGVAQGGRIVRRDAPREHIELRLHRLE